MSINTGESGSEPAVKATGQRTRELFFNPRDPNFHHYPYPHYQRLREMEPVHRSPWGVWFIGRYEHVRALLKDRRFSSQDVPGQLRRRNEMLKTRRVAANQPDNLDALIENSENWFAFLEGMEHVRLRKLVSSAFQKRQIDQMRLHIKESVAELLHDIDGREQFDLMADFAKPLPQRVIAHLLGLPAADTSQCVAWANVIGRIFDPLLSLEEYATLNQSSFEFMAYLRALIAQRRAVPQEDLISALIDAHDNEDRLSEAEIISTIIVMFAAGEETVVGLIGNGVLSLITHPEQRNLLLNDPGLAANAVEELLRYDSPFQMTSRTALEDVELDGKSIRKGDQIYVLLASANRDPAQFADPDKLDIERERPHHMSFADGVHFCVGAQLARIEAQEAFTALFQRYPHLALLPQELTYRDNTILRCLNELHVSTRVV
jgi:cytochrome P450